MQTKRSSATDSTASVQVRLGSEEFAALENFRRGLPKIPARSEALRLLIRRELIQEASA